MNLDKERVEIELDKEVYDILIEVCDIRSLEVSELIEHIIVDSLEQPV